MNKERDEIEKQKKTLRFELETHGAVTFDRKDALARWHAAVQELEAEGFAETELKETGEQSTALEVRRRKAK